jgi:hypothetical protein
MSSEIASFLFELFQTLAGGSNGKLEVRKNDQTWLLNGSKVIGRSIEGYSKLSMRIPKMEFYYLVLQEIIPTVKAATNQRALDQATAIIYQLGVNELERSGRATLSHQIIAQWKKDVDKCKE